MRTFEQYLCEIGDSKNPYPYRISHNKPRPDYPGFESKALFKTDSGHSYLVDISYENDTVDVTFSLTKGKPFALTGAGLKEAFRVVSTVIFIIKDVLLFRYKKGNIKTEWVFFDSASAGKGDSRDASVKAEKQRTKLYMAFAKKQLKQVTIHRVGDDMNSSVIKIKDGFYK